MLQELFDAICGLIRLAIFVGTILAIVCSVYVVRIVLDWIGSGW